MSYNPIFGSRLFGVTTDGRLTLLASSIVRLARCLVTSRPHTVYSANGGF